MTSLNEQAYEHLKKLITDQKLSYHTIYSETRLAKELGISRTPFRDAIHRLVQEGYIDIIPSRGFQLHQLTTQDVIETFQVRSALEGFCTVEITKNASHPKSQELFAELDELMKKMKQILDTTGSIEEFREHDFQFHCKIVDFIENERFTSLFGTYMYRMRHLATLSLAHEGRMAQTYLEHLAILEAMRSGNTEEIYEITLIHMTTPRGINLSDLEY